MKHAIFCLLRADSDEARRALRLPHLEYLERHKASIVAGGPALGETQTPWMMVLLTHFTDRQQAEEFLRHEPYTASGQVFETVEVRAWSQVLPEPEPASLAHEIAKERAAHHG